MSEDYEYERQGVASLFMLCAPLSGWREVSVRERKTRVDYAQCLRALAEEHFPNVDKRARAGQLEHPRGGLALRGV